MMAGNMILSVAKAMELLQLLNQIGKPVPLTELVQRSGYPKSTVFGLLATMRAYDVVTQTADGKYALGLRLFEYGRQVERSWDISLVARPYMELLTQQSGASVMLSYYFLIKFFNQKGSAFGVTDSVILIKSRNLVS